MDVDKWLGSVNLYEAAQVWARFDSACEPHRMVLWSGIEFEQAEDWARQHDRKSLTQAMGPLMDKSNPSCRRNLKNHHQWCIYVHAASILFALFISTGSEVVVLARHPPDRFNPYHESYYQNIEEPWLTACCDPDKFRIMLAHPEIEGAGNCLYQYWPVDRVDDWKSMFPHPKVLKTRPWPHHSRKSLKTSEYHEVDLRRKRHAIMEKLYLYKTGASIYWAVTISTSRATVNQSTKKRRREIDNQKLQVEANTSQANASTLPHQAKSDSPKAQAKSTCKIQAKSVSNSKPKLVSKSQAKMAPKAQAQPTPKTQAKSTSKAQDKSASKATTKPAPTTHVKPAFKTNDKPTPKTQAKSTSKAQDKSASKAGAKPASTTHVKTASKTNTKTASKTNAKPTPKTQAKSTSKEQNKSASKATAKPASTTHVKTASKTKAKTASKTKAKPVSKTKAKSASEAKSKSASTTAALSPTAKPKSHPKNKKPIHPNGKARLENILETPE
ncbi:hypothetical protein BBAD15_g7376 [Beauveria bassiana D1-5]|uniref:Uncharacterized protein n=1 Tax=Beauveria bassiana D1-5 TaxID=1245745 RepID=A0A0A2VLX6_BEABA|nr:hypothetical protein BBAD15_g7376 [Beauveria bassiana D1-5]